MQKRDKKNIFLTGGTGFLGSYLLKKILKDTDSDLHLLVRGVNIKHAESRIEAILKTFSRKIDIKGYFLRTKIYCGNIENEKFGLSSNVINFLKSKIDIIYHCAATTSFKISKEEGALINLGGTRNVLSFAVLCKNPRTISSIFPSCPSTIPNRRSAAGISSFKS